MILEGVNDKAESDPSLLRVLTRAHNIQERLSQDTDLTVHDVAREERVTAAYIYALLRFARQENRHISLCAMRHERNERQLAIKIIRTKSAVESICYLAGAGGLEPPNGGIKIRCLTTWLRPIKPGARTIAAA